LVAYPIRRLSHCPIVRISNVLKAHVWRYVHNSCIHRNDDNITDMNTPSVALSITMTKICEILGSQR